MDTQQVKRPAPGFTLIEVMVTTIILAIIAAIAIPLYSREARAGRRSTAKAMMMQIAQNEERYYTENNKYERPSLIGYASNTLYTTSNYYSITLTGQTATSYTITAVPSQSDPDCGTLTLTNTGVWANSVGAPISKC